MSKHYKEQLSAYLHHELPKEERQIIAEHLLQCEDCRKEHDEIKFGTALAGNLRQADAPARVWLNIAKAANSQPMRKVSWLSQFSLVGLNSAAVICAGLLVVFGALSVAYFVSRQDAPKEVTKVDTTPNDETVPTVNQNANVEMPKVISTDKVNQNTETQPITNPISNNQTQPSNKIPNTQKSPTIANSNVKTLPNVPQTNVTTTPKPIETAEATWKVETIAGQTPNEIAVGETLVTDETSRARVQVANIGQVEIAPNSRVKLLKTNKTEHRLSLEKGLLHAKIDAPPRLFMVDTPSAVAVDLGCEYTLEVDRNGDSKLHVTLGYVALERDGRESIVPAGAMALTKKGQGLGTPFFDDVSPEFQAALYKFDFENGGRESLNKILSEARIYDSLTLWHLLSRTNLEERRKVFETLIGLVKLPAGATKDGILKLNPKMLKLWWKEMENLWFE